LSATVSVSTAAFDGYDLAVALDEIAAAGAGLVEVAYIEGYMAFDETAFADPNAAAVAEALRGAGLASVAVSAHVNAGLPGAVDQLKRRIAFARRLGAGILITNAAPADRRQDFLRNLEALIPEAEMHEVVLAFENPGHGSDALIGTAADGATLVRSVGSPWVRVNYDIGNVFTYSREEVRPEDDIAAALPHAVHLHAKDVRSTPEGWRFMAIGEGSIAYDRVLARLARHEPRIPIGLELPLRLRRPGRRDPVRAPEPLPLPVIRDAVRRSLAYVTERLGA